MLWLRRGLAAPLTALLFVLMVFALLTLQANCTLLRADYYVDVLRRVDFYQFLLTDVAASALDEVRELDGEALPGPLDENSLDSLAPSTEDMVSSVNMAFPPEWVQGNAEHVVNELASYITGERDEFEFTIETGDQFGTLLSEFSVLLRESGAFDALVDIFIIPAVANAIVASVPVELGITSEQATASAHRIVSKDWYEPQVEGAIVEITPYLVGDEESFEVNVPLDSRVDVALQEFKLLLREADAYESLYRDFVEPMVEDSFGSSIRLPYGIVLTKDEIMSAMREVAPPSWIESEFETIIDDATPYLKGETDGFTSEISLVDNKVAAVSVVERVARRKLRELLEGLPECTADHSLNQIISEGFDGIITCIPPNTPVDLVANLIGSEVASAVEINILRTVPDRITFTEADLQETLAHAGIEDSAAALDELRAQIREGWTYTDVDLTQDIQSVIPDGGEGADVSVAIDGIRMFLSEGWTYTHEDFRKDLASRGDGKALSDLDRVRGIFKFIRTYGTLLMIPIVPLVVGIGILGGRDWQGRFVWAFGSFLVASTLAFIFIMLFYGVFVGSRLDALRDGLLAAGTAGGAFSATEALIAGKVIEIAETVANDFLSGIINKSLILIAVGIFGVIISLGWEYIALFARRVDFQRLIRR